MIDQAQGIVRDDYFVSPTAANFRSNRSDEITVSAEWRVGIYAEAFPPTFIIIGVAGAAGAKQAVAISPHEQLAVAWLADAPTLMVSKSSLMSWLSKKRAISRLVTFEAGRMRTSTEAKVAIKRMAILAARHDLDQAWTRVLSRTPDQPVSGPSTAVIASKSNQFVPSSALIEKVREGFRSYSENYSRLVEPRFIPQGIELLRDEDISKFIATRVWRLILSLTDRAALKGKNKLQLGDTDGFLDQLDHLILDRIPVSPKDVTSFLKTLYEEYRQFAADPRALPGRGTLWSGKDGLFCTLDNAALTNSTKVDEASAPQTEVLFE